MLQALQLEVQQLREVVQAQNASLDAQNITLEGMETCMHDWMYMINKKLNNVEVILSIFKYQFIPFSPCYISDSSDFKLYHTCRGRSQKINPFPTICRTHTHSGMTKEKLNRNTWVHQTKITRELKKRCITFFFCLSIAMSFVSNLTIHQTEISKKEDTEHY